MAYRGKALRVWARRLRELAELLEVIARALADVDAADTIRGMRDGFDRLIAFVEVLEARRRAGRGAASAARH